MHYVNLTAVGEDAKETLRHLMLALHGFNQPRDKADRLAAAFPGMLEAVVDEYRKVLVMPQPGAQLRLIGNRVLIEQFLASPLPLRIIRMGMAAKGPVCAVPEDAKAVRFVRDRRFERKHPNGAYERRRVRRAQEQGRQAPSLTRTPRVPSSFSFALPSKSTGHPFHLDVRREYVSQPYDLSDITAYGLCGPSSAIPLF